MIAKEVFVTRKAWIIAGASLVALLLLLVGACTLGRPAYHRFKERRHLEQARESIARNDQRTAVLDLRQALALNPASLEATRLLAGLAAEAQSPAALGLWQRVVELSPTIENQIMLGVMGLRLESAPFPIAAQVVEHLRPRGQTNVACQLLASQLALRLHRTAEAVASLEVAARLEPTNRLYALNLGTLRVEGPEAAAAAAARQELAKFISDPVLGGPALRSLLAVELKAHRGAEALELSRKLIAWPQATLADRLQHLTLLQEAGSPELPAALARMQTSASNQVPQISQTAIWMAQHRRAPEARLWLAQQPPELRSTMPLPIIEADCLVALGDWAGLELRLRQQNWKELEFLRLAYASLAAEKTTGALAAEVPWRAAMREANDRLGALSTLDDLANKWNRPREELLGRILERFPGEKWAGRELVRLAAAAGNTSGLLKAYGAMHKANPADSLCKNNCAALSLLLKVNLSQAHQYARELYAAAPQDPVTVSTYAFSLHLQGRTPAALAALGKLSPSVLEQQPVALYQGLLLWAAGQRKEAAPYLETAAKAKNLLPEERALLAECKGRLSSR